MDPAAPLLPTAAERASVCDLLFQRMSLEAASEGEFLRACDLVQPDGLRGRARYETVGRAHGKGQQEGWRTLFREADVYQRGRVSKADLFAVDLDALAIRLSYKSAWRQRKTEQEAENSAAAFAAAYPQRALMQSVHAEAEADPLPLRATSHKPQATSCMPQAASYKPQAASCMLQTYKLQTASR